jgi:Arc/MetJ family transcription regulator
MQYPRDTKEMLCVFRIYLERTYWNIYSGCMKTTIDIPEAELADAMRFLHAKTKRDAVVTAIQDLNRRHRMARLARHSGTCTFESNASIERMEGGEASHEVG